MLFEIVPSVMCVLARRVKVSFCTLEWNVGYTQLNFLQRNGLYKHSIKPHVIIVHDKARIEDPRTGQSQNPH